MNLQENIQRIKQMMGLNEHSSESMFLLRRVSAEDISIAFKAALNLVSKKYIEKKSKWSMFNLDKFVHMVMGVMMDGLSSSFLNTKYEFPYEKIYDYLHDKYLDDMVERFAEISGRDGYTSDLNEHSNESMFLLRRVSAQDITEAYRDALEYASKKYIDEKRWWNKPNLDKFVSMVMQLMMDNLHPVLIHQKEEFPYDEIYDFLREKYLDEIVERFLEISGKGNNIKGLNESKIPVDIRRRIEILPDEEVLKHLKEWMMRSHEEGRTDRQISVAFRETAWRFLQKTDSFTITEDTINEIMKFLKDKYLDEINEFNDSLFGTENDDDKYCFIKTKSVFGGAGFTDCVRGWHQFLRKYGYWLPHLNWNEIREKLNNAPKNTNPRLLLAKPLEGHIYEYHFSIAKINTK